MQKEHFLWGCTFRALLFLGMLLLTPASTEASSCHHHYNHSAWHDQGMAIVFCLDSPEYDSCALHRHSTGEFISHVPKHPQLDNGRQVYTLSTTLGSNFPYAIDFVCQYGVSTDTINIANGAYYENGCCPAPSYLGGSCCQGSAPLDAGLPDLHALDAGNPGNEPACDVLLSREYEQGTQELWGVTSGSNERLTFTIDAVPTPNQLTFARLSMSLIDADHPNEEGFVYINGSSALPLPANSAWEHTVSATLTVPIDRLVEGTNIIQFGPGSLDLTYYKVSHVALAVFGVACAPPVDAAVLDSTQPDISLPESTQPDAAQPDTTTTDTSAGGAHEQETDPGADDGKNHKTQGGCNCSTVQLTSRALLSILVQSALFLWWRRARGSQAS